MHTATTSATPPAPSHATSADGAPEPARAAIALALPVTIALSALSPACAARAAVASRVAGPAAAQPPAPVRAARIPVHYGHVNQLRGVLEHLLTESRREGRAPEVRAVVADAPSNSLIVFGTEAGIAAAQALIESGCRDAGGGDGPDGRVVEVIPLARARVTEVFSLVRPITGPRASVSMDIPSNSLVVADTPASLRRVREVVARLDVAPQHP